MLYLHVCITRITNLFFLWTSFDFVGWYKIWLGADASQYSFYLKYFIEGPTSIGYEQGVHYFWFLNQLVVLSIE